MADIDVQQRSSMAWLWWLLGFIVLALIAWALLAGGDDEVATAPIVGDVAVTEVEPTVPAGAAPGVVADTAGVPVSQIIGSPATWMGRTVGGEVTVGEVPTDRGFWIEEEGQRLFAVLVDRPAEQPVDINPGQTLRISQAVLRDPSYVANLSGEAIDADTRRILEGQPVFLVVDEASITTLAQQ